HRNLAEMDTRHAMLPIKAMQHCDTPSMRTLIVIASGVQRTMSWHGGHSVNLTP
ncbi:hypothetical protein HAX54_052441, partial [Datura stramonium]|nr:hypothetical protein [Datura stramonium]